MLTHSTTHTILALCICLAFRGVAQEATDSHAPGDADPCGYPDTSALSYKMAASVNWGYGYDSLRADLARWSKSPFVRIDSIGASVQHRALYVLSIEDTGAAPVPRRRIWIHARTHPNEVQGTWVTNEMIAFLLSPSPLARQLRDSCVFNVLPMLNPDGVELLKPRENANGVDIESNWGAVPGEPEVQVLRAHLAGLMAMPNPIRIALNMHSAFDCKRYFVFHAASGTSGLYAGMEEHFITLVGNNFLGGFEPWNYFVSWTNGAPLVYPESWFWYNCGESVLALTYEDMNCPSAGSYDVTAAAMLAGIEEFLSTPTFIASDHAKPEGFVLAQNFPNPFNGMSEIGFRIAHVAWVTLQVYDVLGREVALLVNERKPAGAYAVRFNAGNLPSGVYYARLQAGSTMAVISMVLVR